MTDRIRIKQYEQAADEKVSIGGIKWQRKWDVCIQCDSREEAEALRARLAEPEETVTFGLSTCPRCGEENPAEIHTCTPKPEPEPVAYLCENAVGHKYFRWKKPPSTYKPVALYTASPQREWQGLTDEEIDELAEANLDFNWKDGVEDFARAIEAKLKEKNT